MSFESQQMSGMAKIGKHLSQQMSVFPLEAQSFEKKQIFQKEQKTIFSIIKPVWGIFF